MSDIRLRLGSPVPPVLAAAWLAPRDKSDVGNGSAHTWDPSKAAARTLPQSLSLSPSESVALHKFCAAAFSCAALLVVAAAAVSPSSCSCSAALSGSSDRHLLSGAGNGADGGGVRNREAVRSRLVPPLRHACHLASGGSSRTRRLYPWLMRFHRNALRRMLVVISSARKAPQSAGELNVSPRRLRGGGGVTATEGGGHVPMSAMSGVAYGMRPASISSLQYACRWYASWPYRLYVRCTYPWILSHRHASSSRRSWFMSKTSCRKRQRSRQR